MKKSTKGALAAAAAGSLLLGGAGSLAYWTDAETITGASITSGHLSLDTTGCDGWKLADATTSVDYLSQKLVPGDRLTNHCVYTVAMEGTNLKAKLDVTAPTLTGDLSTALLKSGSTFKLNASGTSPVTVTPGTAVSINGGDTVTADIVVELPNSAAVTTMDQGGTLGNITVTATQLAH
jgi:alternate signal-mediated exported protein